MAGPDWTVRAAECHQHVSYWAAKPRGQHLLGQTAPNRCSLQQAPDCSMLRTEPETSPPPQCFQGGLPPPSHTWGRRLTCPESGVLSPTVSTICFPWHLAHSIESTAYHEWCLQPEIKPRVAAKPPPWPPGSPLHAQAQVHWQHLFPLTMAVMREALAETHLLTACPALTVALLSKETNPRHPYRSSSHRALAHPRTPPQHSWHVTKAGAWC